jgi:DNA-binding NtrC family response regulator
MAAQAGLFFLVISADDSLAARLGQAAQNRQPEILRLDGYVSAFRLLEQRAVDYTFADCRGAEVSLRELLTRLNYRCPSAELVAVADAGSLGERLTPYDFGCSAVLAPDVGAAELRRLIESTQRGRVEVARCGWVGKSPAVRSLSSLVLTAAPTAATVLFIGESGTGKELAARAIHDNSPRKDKPFIAVNCSALAEGVLESELFGHEKGAFTHAFAQKQGVFEAAHGGTIFLDEIGDMPLPLQAKLLRVLEERQVRRVGGTVTLDVDIRVVAATNHDLSVAAEEGRFRRDLFYRLSVIRLEMPRLFDRLHDIPLLAQSFLAAAGNDGKFAFDDEAYDRMLAYHWPGNIRELKNFVERLSVLVPGKGITAGIVREFLEEQHSTVRNLPVITGRTPETARHDLILAALAELKRDLNEIKQAVGAGSRLQPRFAEREAVEVTSDDKPSNLTHLEIEAIKDALKQVNGNRRQAAKLLGIGERTLYRKIRQYGL